MNKKQQTPGQTLATKIYAKSIAHLLLEPVTGTINLINTVRTIGTPSELAKAYDTALENLEPVPEKGKIDFETDVSTVKEQLINETRINRALRRTRK